MSRAAGTRVWVVRNADATTVYAYGFGTYIGDHPRPGWAAGPGDRAMAEDAIRRSDAEPLDLDAAYDRAVGAARLTRAEADRRKADGAARLAAEQARPLADRVDELLQRPSLNPKIVLDTGGVVWGCDCWWGDADTTTPASWARGRQIVTVPAPYPVEPATGSEMPR